MSEQAPLSLAQRVGKPAPIGRLIPGSVAEIIITRGATPQEAARSIAAYRAALLSQVNPEPAPTGDDRAGAGESPGAKSE